MSDFDVSGSCLCGQVRYRVRGPARVFQYCHCTRCQKVTGSAHASNIIVDPSHFEWVDGESLVGRYEHPEAKHFAVSFCTHCGSALPWLTQSARSVVVPAGTLDQDPGIRPRHNIFLADKAPWYVGSDSIRQYQALPTDKD